MQSKHYIWLAVIVGLIVGVGGWLLFGPKTIDTTNTSGNASSTGQTGTTTDLGNGVSVTTNGGGSVEVISNTSITPPSLTGPIVFGSSVSADQQVMLRAQEETDIAALKKDPTRMDVWLKLGNERKLAGDYVGAAEAWAYVAKAGSASITFIAYGNLGDLYTNFVPNYAKAQANLKAAVAIKPDFIDFYRHLVELYTLHGYGTKADAQAVVAQGLKANPGNKDLLALQAQLQ